MNNDGGPTSGYAIPFTINEDGSRTQGTVTVENKVPTFTPAGGTSEALNETTQSSSKSLSD